MAEADHRNAIRLRGIAGWVDGESFDLPDDGSVVIGRSRSCDISLRRIRGYIDREPSERDSDHDFNTVSRRHLRIEVHGTDAIIEDLSTNGSYCNDELLTAPLTINLDEGPVELRLGTRERLRLKRGADSSIKPVAADDGSDVRQPEA